MNYELQLEQFSGPIGKLLQLIEERKLEITELSLAQVTADFLTYLQKLTDEDNTQTNADYTQNYAEKSPHKSVSGPRPVRVSPRLLADFVVIASQLLLIKSKALLPGLSLTNEEEKSIKDLESRLRFYQEFKPAINYLEELSEQNNASISRPLFFGLPAGRQGRPAIFYPAENIKIEELYKAIDEIFQTFKELSESQIIKSSLISLEEKIQEIVNRLNLDSRGRKTNKPKPVNFDELMKEKSRSEIVVLFLALLHLLADQLVKVEQKNKFSDIIITK
jgi:segregation and condensation protein A